MHSDPKIKKINHCGNQISTLTYNNVGLGIVMELVEI